MIILSALFILGATKCIFADQITPRYNSGCDLFLNNTRIYCYGGGYSKTANINIASDSDQYYIDVSVDFSVSSAQNNWVKVTNPANFALEPTFSYVGVKISDNTFLINGGVGTNDAKTYMKNQTITWRVDTNHWTSITNNSGIPQTYYGSGVFLSNNSVAFFGGISAIGTMAATVSNIATLQLSQTPFWNARISSIPPGNPIYSHTATLDSAGTSIYYIGGRNIVRGATYSYPFISMGSILVFHTDTSTWETRNVGGSVIPTQRSSHTSTLLPNSTKILVYGGATSNSAGIRTPVNDYAYTYDYDLNTYQQISVANGDATSGAGPRFGHNAVLRNNILFILFGIDQNQLGTSSFFALDINEFKWISSYYANGTPTPSSSNSSSSSSDSSGSSNSNSSSGSSNSNSNSNNSSSGGSYQQNPSHLSSGAIAGIVVGVVAGAAIVGLVSFFLYRKKNKQTEKYPTYWDITKSDISPPPANFLPQTNRMPTNTANQNDLDAPSPISPITESSTVVNDKLWPPDIQREDEVKTLERVKPDIGKINK